MQNHCKKVLPNYSILKSAAEILHPSRAGLRWPRSLDRYPADGDWPTLVLTFSLSLSLSLSLSIYLSIYLPLSLSLSISTSLHLILSLYLYLSLPLPLSISLSLSLSLSPSLYLSISLSLSLSLSLFLWNTLSIAHSHSLLQHVFRLVVCTFLLIWKKKYAYILHGNRYNHHPIQADCCLLFLTTDIAVAESNGKLPQLLIPSKTAALIPEFAVEYLPSAELQPRFLRLQWWCTTAKVRDRRHLQTDDKCSYMIYDGHMITGDESGLNFL